MTTRPLCNEVCGESKAAIFDLPAHGACINSYTLRLAGVVSLLLLMSHTVFAGDVFDFISFEDAIKPEPYPGFTLNLPRMMAEHRAQEAMTRCRTYAVAIAFAGASIGAGLYFGLRRKTTQTA
jgi:hypothetical protein